MARTLLVALKEGNAMSLRLLLTLSGGHSSLMVRSSLLTGTQGMLSLKLILAGCGKTHFAPCGHHRHTGLG